MHIKIAGKSVISVRTKRIVHGVESEAFSRCDRSGKSGAGAVAATFAAAQKTTMKPSSRDRRLTPWPASLDGASPSAPPLDSWQHGGRSRRADRRRECLQEKSPPGTASHLPQPAPAIAGAQAKSAPQPQ